MYLNSLQFFETEAFVVYPDDEGVSNNDSSGATWDGSDDYIVVLNVTEMRVDPIYSSWANWSQVSS